MPPLDIAKSICFIKTGSINNHVYAFKGIPYAMAKRFKPPQDPDTRGGFLECKDFGPVAKQVVAWIPDSTQNQKSFLV